MNAKQIFITGATGFIGSALTAELLRRGHYVSALTRPGSENKLPRGMQGCTRRRAPRQQLCLTDRSR
jgi:uncharacterized protein YbjT (DUF2867 family)